MTETRLQIFPKELVLTGRLLGAEEAAALGLVERTCAEGDAHAQAHVLARDIARNAPLALQVAKRAMNAWARGQGDGLERLGQALLHDSADKRARMTAFLEKKARKG